MCGILASDSTIFSLILLFENVTHCRTEFLISLALELPCVLTTSLLRPIRGAQPYSDASIVFNVSLSAPFTSNAPILDLSVE